MLQRLPRRATHFSDWYNELINKSGLAENASVRGCMVIKPYGFAIWEKIQALLDQAFKKTGHVNVYFPLLIPKSCLNKEAEHVAGFAKECAVVTHYRLKQIQIGNKSEIIVDPEAKLEEELIVRPTSEAMIWNAYKNWIQSYRDLPILMNQWCNVVRWEMRPRLFLRNSEFLWQEGHTAHATCEEAEIEALQMIYLYQRIAKDYMAMPLVLGTKTAHEKFAGADITYTLEALMQDGKVLQVGTSHFLGQQFSKAFDVTFTNRKGKLDYVWGTSWGVSTRLIGALIMMHADDDGLVLPPKIAPIQVVMIPVYQNVRERDLIVAHFNNIKEELLSYDIMAKLDDQDTRKPGWKFAEYELKGIPIRMVLGPNDLVNNTIELVRRDNKEKVITSRDDLVSKTIKLLDEIQANILEKALIQRDINTIEVDRYDIFKEIITTRGGFIMAHWDTTTETEKRIQAETKATIRCIPLHGMDEFGRCIYSEKPSMKRVVFAQAY